MDWLSFAFGFVTAIAASAVVLFIVALGQVKKQRATKK